MNAQEMGEALRRPFLPNEIEWRIGQAGDKSGGGVWAKVLAYVTARAVRDRLDEVFGIDGWKEEYRPMLSEKSGIMCRLWFKVGEDWLWREDGAQQTEIESFKGGISDSLKRAAASLGIGRYLYNLDETWVETSSTKSADFPHYAKTKKGTAYYWKTPTLPAWALPSSVKSASDRDIKGFHKAVTAMFGACSDLGDLKDFANGFVDEAKGIGEFDWLKNMHKEHAARIEEETMDAGVPK